MKSIPKDVELYIERLIHQEHTKKLITEYHSKYYYSSAFDVLKLRKNDRIVAQYRGIGPIIMTNYNVYAFDGRKTDSILPSRYIFSSGLDSRLGYKNE